MAAGGSRYLRFILFGAFVRPPALRPASHPFRFASRRHSRHVHRDSAIFDPETYVMYLVYNRPLLHLAVVV